MKRIDFLGLIIIANWGIKLDFGSKTVNWIFIMIIMIWYLWIGKNEDKS